MAEWLKHGFRQHGGAWALTIFSLGLLVVAHPTMEYAATAHVKLEFVRTNAPSLSPLDYATNGSGWKLARTEARFIRSEFTVRKALERLSPLSTQNPPTTGPVSLTMDRLESSLVPEGIQLRAVGKNPGETAKLVNAVAEVYRDERNQLWPAPPECRALSISLPEQAQPDRRRMNSPPLFRFTLGAASLALGVALRFARKSPRLQNPFLRVFLSWHCPLFGLGLLVTPFSVAVAFAGATLVAFLLTAGVGCIAWVVSQKAPVPSKLLAYTFAIACVVLMGQGALVTFVWSEHPFDTARIRVSIKETGADGESPSSYDPKFIATECALIESRPILRQAVDQLSLANFLSQSHGLTLNQREAEERVLRNTTVRPVKNTSLIDILYWNQDRTGRGRLADGIAAIYGRYWNERSKTNLARRLTAVTLGSRDSPRIRDRWIAGRYGLVMTARLLSALFVLAGALCAALLAKNPVRLWFILHFAIVYLVLLGVLAVVSSLTPDTYAATCLVRIWPPEADTPRHRSDQTEAMLRREGELATSAKVLAQAVQTLDANPGFTGQFSERWQTMSPSERQLWLHRHLKVIPGADTYLMKFSASADDPNDAAEVANTAAAAYCNYQAASAEPSIEGRGRLDVEIMDKAVPNDRAQEWTNPLERGLTNGLDQVIWFLVGAGIGCLGFLVETVRAATLAHRKTPANAVDRGGDRGIYEL